MWTSKGFLRDFRLMLGGGLGLFERPHLPDKISSAPCRGPIHGLHCTGPLESKSFFYRRPQGGPLAP